MDCYDMKTGLCKLCNWLNGRDGLSCVNIELSETLGLLKTMFYIVECISYTHIKFLSYFQYYMCSGSFILKRRVQI